MTDTAYADVTLTGDLNHVTTAQLAAIDLLASLLTGTPGWRVTVEVDPSTVITATPPRGSDFTARFTDEDGEDG